MTEYEILLATLIMLFIQIIILVITIGILYHLTQTQIKYLNKGVDKQIIRMEKNSKEQIDSSNEGFDKQLDKMESNNADQINALKEGVDKQLERMDKHNADQINALNRSTQSNIEKLLEISNELKNSNKEMEKTNKELNELKISFEKSVEKMSIVAEVMGAQAKMIPDLVVTEEKFKGDIPLRKDVESELEFWVHNVGNVTALNSLVTLVFHKDLKVTNNIKGTMKTGMNKIEDGRTIILINFIDMPLKTGLGIKLDVKVIASKIGSHEIEWSAECLTRPAKEGKFKTVASD